jgi:hypothetical protein
VKIRLAVMGIAVAGLLAGCSNVVDGRGSATVAGPSAPGFPAPSSPAGSATPGAPTASTPGAPASPVAPPTSCPQVSYPAAHLSFTCITSGMTQQLDGAIWPLAETKTVEASTGWVLEEGGGHWGAQAGQSLASIAEQVRHEMVEDDDYGTNPTVTTAASKATTVGREPAYLLQTTMTLNPTWAKTAKTAVKQEKLWIIAVQVGANDVSLWYTSVPDLVRSLWAKVPAIIATIKTT